MKEYINLLFPLRVYSTASDPSLLSLSQWAYPNLMHKLIEQSNTQSEFSTVLTNSSEVDCLSDSI